VVGLSGVGRLALARASTWAWWADGVGKKERAEVRRYWALQRVHQPVKLERRGCRSKASTSRWREQPATRMEA